MFVQLPQEEMHTMNGRHLIYLASVKAGMSIPQWSEYGADTIDGHPVIVDFTRGGVEISDCLVTETL